MKYDAIKGLPKGLVEDVAKFLKREPVVEAADCDRKEEKEEKKPIKLTKGWGDGGKSMKTSYGKLAKEEFEDIGIIDEQFGIGVILDGNEESVEVMFEHGIEVINSDEIMFEEVEELNELSKDTLKSYQDKAKASPAFEKKKGKPSKATVAIRDKRTKGLEAVKKKLEAIYKVESEAKMKNIEKLNGKLDDHFGAEAPGVLKKHGYELLHTGKHDAPYGEGGDVHIHTYIKKHDNGHVTMIALHKKPKTSFSGSAYEAKALSSKGSSFSGHSAHHGIWDEKHFDEHKTNMMPKFEQHVMQVKEHGDNKSSW